MFTLEHVIPKNTQVVFVADLFLSDYQGGAELTTEALIDSAPGLRVFKLHSVSLSREIVEKNKHLTWVLCNWSQAPRDGLVALVNEGCKFVCVEYDYKYCIHRSSHLHKLQTNKECDCHLQKNFAMALYKRAAHVFFMSQGQKEEYERLFPNMNTWENTSVLSSVWKESDLDAILALSRNTQKVNDKWAVLTGGSWIKNQEKTEAYCRERSIRYDTVGKLPYWDFLAKLAEYQGLVFHPAGFDTCPRLVVEAKLLGLALDLNDNVQHQNEKWFKGTSSQVMIDYLRSRPSIFWQKIKESM